MKGSTILNLILVISLYYYTIAYTYFKIHLDVDLYLLLLFFDAVGWKTGKQTGL